MKRISAWMLALLLMLLPAALAEAEPIVLYGTVVCTEPISVTSIAAGQIERLFYSVGDHVAAGDVIADVSTQKVYAPADGTVYLFGDTGDKITDIEAQYGAAAYIDPAFPYIITASAKNANNATVRVISGETVYLRCRKDGVHQGTGMVVKVKDEQYTVNVMDGKFLKGESVYIYREKDYGYASIIGRSTVQTRDMIPCAGSGYLVRSHAENGASVKKGTLLYETIDGVFSPNSTGHAQIVAPVPGILAAIYEQLGAQINAAAAAPAAAPAAAQDGNKDAAIPANGLSQDASSAAALQPMNANIHRIAEIYPDDSLRIKAYAPESALNAVHVNDTVSVVCQYMEDIAAPVSGSVEKITRTLSPDGNGMEAQYAVYIKVQDAKPFYYGMHVEVSIQ